MQVVVEGGRDWAAILLQGPVTAVIAAAGVFGLYWVTRRHQRRDDLERRALEDMKASHERAGESAARVIDACLRRLEGWAPGESPIGRSNDLIAALLILSATESEERPHASAWFRGSARRLTKSQSASPPDVKLGSEIANNVLIVVTAWIRLSFDDARFAQEFPVSDD